MAQFFLPNPGFELGDQDWTLGSGLTIEDDGANARTGAWVGKMAAPAASFRQAVAVAVRPGGKLSASVWIKQSAGFDGTPKVIIEWFDEAGVEISQDGGNGISSGTTSYTQSILSNAEAPDRAKSAKIVGSGNGDSTGTAWFDDFSLSGDFIETIPATAEISSHRLLSSETIARFDPLIGEDKFSDFNSGMSDKWAGVYTFTRAALGGDLNALLAFLRRVGNIDRFFAYDPDRRTPVNGVVNGLTVDGAVSQGTNRIPIKDGTLSTTPLVAGDYVEIRAQYFQVQRDVEIGPEGTGDLIVWPAVRSDLVDDEEVITDNPVMVARITSGMEWARTAGDHTAPTISWEEV